MPGIWGETPHLFCSAHMDSREILGFVPQDHVSDYLADLPPEVLAKHAATVWQVRNRDTGHTLKKAKTDRSE